LTVAVQCIRYLSDTPGQAPDILGLALESLNRQEGHLRVILALLPVLGVFLGATVFNRVTPFILGMPVFFAWTLFNVLMMSLIMLIIYRMDVAAGRVED
jgi:hypothetical protein